MYAVDETLKHTSASTYPSILLRRNRSKQNAHLKERKGFLCSLNLRVWNCKDTYKGKTMKASGDINKKIQDCTQLNNFIYITMEVQKEMMATCDVPIASHFISR